MSSIPLPELQVRPPTPPENPIDQMGKLVNLRGLMQAQPVEQQQREQALQSGQLDVQNKQYAIEQRNAINRAYLGAIKSDPTTGSSKFDDNQFMNDVGKAGFGSAGQEIAEHLATYHKTLNENKEAQQKLQLGQDDEGGAAGYALKKSGYNPGLAHSMIDYRLSDPNLDPQHQQTYLKAKQSLAAAEQQGPDAAKAAVQAIADPMIAGSEKYAKQDTEDTKAQIEAQRLAAQMPGGQLEDVKKAQMRDYLKNPGVPGEPLPVSKRSPATYEAWAAKQNPLAAFAIQAGSFAKPPAPEAAAAPTPEAALAKLDPRQRATIKQVGEYQQKKSEILQRLPGAARENFNAALDAAYPNYSEQNYDARHKMMLDYTSGKTSTQINSLNTAMGHINTLGTAADALQNGNVQLINSLANRLKVAVGKDPVTTYKTIVHRVGPELAAAYIQGGGGEGERGTTAADFGEDLSPQQIKGNIGITANLLGSKISSNENQWKTTMERDDFRDRFLSPEAKAALQKWSPSTAVTSKKGGTTVPKAGGFDWGSAPKVQ